MRISVCGKVRIIMYTNAHECARANSILTLNIKGLDRISNNFILLVFLLFNNFGFFSQF